MRGFLFNVLIVCTVSLQAGCIWSPHAEGIQHGLEQREEGGYIRMESSKRLVFILLGKTGSGKGTVGSVLSEHFGIAHISMGDMYRNQLLLEPDSALADAIAYLKERDKQYSTDAICVGMLMKRLSAPDCRYGYILDGFPRTTGQAEILCSAILRENDICIPIHLDVPDELIRDRLATRFFCKDCNKQVRGHELYSLEDLYCPTCNGQLTKRADDVQMADTERKMKFHRASIDPILDILQNRAPVREFKISSQETPQMVNEDVSAWVDGMLDEACEMVLNR